MASADCLDAWDDCFNFFKGKSPYHATRHTRLSYFTRNQRVGWKLSCALFIFMCSVFFQSLLLSWDGYTDDGQEKIPPLMLFGPASALYSVIALWIAAVHLYQPTFNGPRILLHYRRPSPCSWEILDWVFFEGSTTSTIVSFVFFWLVTLPYSDVAKPGLHAFGTIVQLMVVAVDFYFTAPQFKANHVFLVLIWPVAWIFIQHLWVISGHQPSNELFNFHTSASPVCTALLFLGTVVVFYVLMWCSYRLQRRSDDSAQAAANTSENSYESSSCVTPTSEHASTAPFELVIDSRSTFGSKADKRASDKAVILEVSHVKF